MSVQQPTLSGSLCPICKRKKTLSHNCCPQKLWKHGRLATQMTKMQVNPNKHLLLKRRASTAESFPGGQLRFSIKHYNTVYCPITFLPYTICSRWIRFCYKELKKMNPTISSLIRVNSLFTMNDRWWRNKQDSNYARVVGYNKKVHKHQL